MGLIVRSSVMIFPLIYVPAFEVGEVTGTIKNLVSVAKHKLPALLGSLNVRVSMKSQVKPPTFQLALWIDNPAEMYARLSSNKLWLSNFGKFLSITCHHSLVLI